MAKKHSEPDHHFTMVRLLSNLFGVVTSTRPFLELIEELMIKKIDKIQRRMLGMAIVYLTLLAGIVILTIGFVLLFIDFTAIPRGIAFTLGGLVLVSGSALVMQLSKK